MYHYVYSCVRGLNKKLAKSLGMLITPPCKHYPLAYTVSEEEAAKVSSLFIAGGQFRFMNIEPLQLPSLPKVYLILV